MKLILNKDNTFCISLYSKEDRWQRMQERFTKFNIDVTRFKAADNEKDLTVPYVNYINTLQKCCTQSHINLWKHIVNNNLEYAFILEDDAMFDKYWKEKLNVLTENFLDPEWHAIFLNASEPMSPINTWMICKEQFLTGGYIISNKGAKILLDSFKECYCMIDWMTSRLQLLGHSYCVFPWLIIQEGRESTIGSNVDADHAKVVRCLNDINYSLDNYI